jgi:hypothetical protein
MNQKKNSEKSNGSSFANVTGGNTGQNLGGGQNLSVPPPSITQSGNFTIEGDNMVTIALNERLILIQ